jgi:hypothetical protein
MDTPSPSTLTTTVISQCRLRAVWSQPLQADSGGSDPPSLQQLLMPHGRLLSTEPHCCDTHNNIETIQQINAAKRNDKADSSWQAMADVAKRRQALGYPTARALLSDTAAEMDQGSSRAGHGLPPTMPLCGSQLLPNAKLADAHGAALRPLSIEAETTARTSTPVDVSRTRDEPVHYRTRKHRTDKPQPDRRTARRSRCR